MFLTSEFIYNGSQLLFQFVIDEFMAVVKPIVVKTKKIVVSCEGQEGESSHPRVFLKVAGTGVCPYCGKIFEKISS
jgi:uncharacterized Zn-finger protein